MSRGLIVRKINIHSLIRLCYYQIREAAQALLQAELQRLGKGGRSQLAKVWYPVLPRSSSGAVRIATEKQADTSLQLSSALPPHFDMRGVSGDLKQQQATAVVLLGVIAAEFQRSHEDKKPKKRPSTSRTQSDDGELDSKVIQDTAKSLEMLLLDRVSDRYTVNSPIRRAMADLMGRGFIHWANHVDAGAILLFLLELSCETSSRLSSPMASDIPTSELLRVQPNATTCHIARHALVLCAMARPIVFISTVAKEVGVVQPASSSPGSISSSLKETGYVAMLPYERGTSNVQSLGMTCKTIVQRAKKAIIHVLETLIEKMQEEVVFQLVEVHLFICPSIYDLTTL